MNRVLIVFAAVLSSCLAQAVAPVVVKDSVIMNQAKGSRLVTIRYRLETAPVIVTVDIQTNVTGSATQEEADWLSVGDACFKDVTGDVNMLVETAGEKEICWNPEINFTGVVARNRSCRAVVKAWSEDYPPDYMTVDLRRDADRLVTEPRVRYYTSTNALPDAEGVAADRYREGFLLMRLIRSRGENFWMGSPSTESSRQPSYEEQHEVVFTENDYYIGVFEFTYGQASNMGTIGAADRDGLLDIKLDGNGTWLYQYQSVMPGCVTNFIPVCGSYGRVRGDPAQGYDWPKDGHAVNVNTLLGQLRKRCGVEFDLPTDAQWEYCCRAGTVTANWFSDTVTAAEIGKWAWIDSSNSDGGAKKNRHVGLLQPNPWGLYDMIGNSFELCLDRYAEITTSTRQWEPCGPTNSANRVYRGGGCAWDYTMARSAARTTEANKGAMQGVRLVAPVGLKWDRTVNRSLSVQYDLDHDMIVTADVQTNVTGVATENESDWVSIGAEHLRNLRGDVNAKIPMGRGRRIFWRADENFPDQNIGEGAVRLLVNKWEINDPPDYMVVSLVKANAIAYYPSEGALPGGIDDIRYRTDSIVMRRIPAQGVKWCMGSPTNEIGRTSAETQHYVQFEDVDYYMAVFPLTVGQYAPFDGKIWAKMWQYGYNYHGSSISPNHYAGKDWRCAPATAIYNRLRQGANPDTTCIWPSYAHDVADKSLLGQWRLLTGVDFDLPTEAQWEFACRAGSGHALNNDTDLYHETAGVASAEVAWYDVNSKVGTEKMCWPVGQKRRNAWGLYDMHGNIFEMCLDYYSADLGSTTAVDPKGPENGDCRVVRGGCYSYSASSMRSAARTKLSGNAVESVTGCRFICPVTLKW